MIWWPWTSPSWSWLRHRQMSDKYHEFRRVEDSAMSDGSAGLLSPALFVTRSLCVTTVKNIIVPRCYCWKKTCNCLVEMRVWLSFFVCYYYCWLQLLLLSLFLDNFRSQNYTKYTECTATCDHLMPELAIRTELVISLVGPVLKIPPYNPRIISAILFTGSSST